MNERETESESESGVREEKRESETLKPNPTT